MNVYYVAAIWLGMALLASMVSIWIAVPAALVEIVIGALFGLTHGLIDKTQYTVLVTVVILSAFVPTLIAQQLFRPTILDAEEEEALGEEDLSIIHHQRAQPPGGSRTRSAAPSPDPADPSSR